MMKNTEKIKVIDGNFTYDEAKEILMNLISSKINFHNIKNFSSQEWYGKEDDVAKKRIPALKKEMEKLETILSEAKKNNKRLIVNSEINITLIDQ